MKLQPNPEDLEPPFRGKQGLELLKELIKYRATHVVTVVDPHGKCKELLEEALDPTDLERFISDVLKLMDKVGKEEWGVLVIDVRNLPRRPRRPYCRIIWELRSFSTLGTMMIIFYTNDPEGRPRWVNTYGPFIIC